MYSFYFKVFFRRRRDQSAQEQTPSLFRKQLELFGYFWLSSLLNRHLFTIPCNEYWRGVIYCS